VRPTMEVDPSDGSLRFSFQTGRRKSDIDETIERLLELLGELAADRKRRVVMIFDEFQEIISLDPKFPNLMRAVFQTQPEVSHVYLGSKRHILERIFNDKNEPFWRSAKQLEIGMIPPAKFGPFLRDRFAASGKAITPEALEQLLAVSGGHPYGTQELAYFVWELIAPGGDASIADIETAVSRVLRSENNHFAQLWDEAPHPQRLVMLALADDPTSTIYSADYHQRHELPANPTLQTALAGLIRKEIAGRGPDGEYRVIEPFLAEWLTHEQRDYMTLELTRSKPASARASSPRARSKRSGRRSS
jgi:hypothetical protein